MKEIKVLKALGFFLENPYEEVYLRDLARKLKLSPYGIKKYVELFIEQDLVLEERRANLRYFKANTSNLLFKHLKISFNLSSLLKSKIIEFLKEKISNVSSIVLFGSMAKGENDKKSDIDLVIIGKEKYLSMSKFEEEFSREINLHTFSWDEWNKKAEKDPAFYYDVIGYGLPLYGELPIVVK